MSVIQINNVTKEFKLGQLNSIKTSAQNFLNRFTGRPVERPQSFKALEGINLSIEKGDVVGLIGTNGAGKSTLLKLISGISAPTSGSIDTRGSIAPLIEVGSGLHPELTGRENIFLNGAILGIPKDEIRRKFDEIVQFAELEDFIHTPVKRYSSGMRVRLGFSIATTIRSDILIVDEVLAVGDLAFQRKCFDRMEDIIGSEDRTVLLVSHNIRQIERICSRAILMEKGRVVLDGATKEVVELFYQRSNEKIQTQQKEKAAARKIERKSGEVDLVAATVMNENGEEIEALDSGAPLRVKVQFYAKHKMSRPEIVIGTHRTDFVYLTAASTYSLDEQDRPDFEEGLNEIECVIEHFPFVEGVYCIRACVFDKNRRLVYNGESLTTFSVKATITDAGDPGLRTVDLPTNWKIGGREYEGNGLRACV